MQGGLIHEMDTTDDDDYLLAVYWWGKPAETDVNYAYSNMIKLIFKYRPLFPVNSKRASIPTQVMVSKSRGLASNDSGRSTVTWLTAALKWKDLLGQSGNSTNAKNIGWPRKRLPAQQRKSFRWRAAFACVFPS